MDRTIDRPEYDGQFMFPEAGHILEEIESRSRMDAYAEACKDTLAPGAPFENPNQECLNLASRKKGQGGATHRPPPPVAWILGPCLGRPSTRRPGFAAPFMDIAGASDEHAAAMMQYVYRHRGRRMGMSSRDFAWQAEITVARSLGYGFFDTERALQDPPKISDIAARAILGDEETTARRRYVALLCTADRMNKMGITMSGPEIANLLRGVATSTAWAVVKWAEKRGLTFRMHRYKPSKSPDGPPVKYSANWYGIGPGLLRHRDVYLGQKQIDLVGETTPGLAADALAGVRTERRKHRGRHTRMRSQIATRRRGAATGFAAGEFHDRPETPRGAAMPSRSELAGLILEGETKRDVVRAKIAASDGDRDSEIAAQARAMVAGEVSAPDFDAIQAADVESRAEAVAAVQEIGGLDAIEHRAEVEAAIVWLAWKATESTEGGATTGADASPPVDASPSARVVGPVRRREPIRDTIRSRDGAVPEENLGKTRTNERRRTGPTTRADGEASTGGEASAPPFVTPSATPHDTTSGSDGPDTRKPPPSHTRPETRPQEPDRPPPVAAGRIPEGNRPIRKPKRDRGNVGDASAGALETAIAGMQNRELAALIGQSLSIEKKSRFGEPIGAPGRRT